MVPLTRHVVVVALEPAFGDAGPPREGVQFLERRVAHQVRPQPPVCRPARRIDEDGHDVTVGPGSTHNAGAFDEAVEAVAAATDELLDRLEIRGAASRASWSGPQAAVLEPLSS